MEQRDQHIQAADPENPERRVFTLQSALAILSGVVITVTGCDDSPTSPSPGQDDITGSVSLNHGHSAVITSATLTAGNAVMLNIQGGATHPHTVELSAEEVGQIAARQRVSKQSSTDDSPDAGVHLHTVTFN